MLLNRRSHVTDFATCYQELNELASLLSNVANAEVLVQETGDELLLLHRVVHGGASRSYGIKAARQVLVRIEANSQVAVGLAPQG